MTPELKDIGNKLMDMLTDEWLCSALLIAVCM